MSGTGKKGPVNPCGHTEVHDEAVVGPPGTGMLGLCKCPECGTVIRHRRSEPCGDHPCPKCGSAMIRGD